MQKVMCVIDCGTIYLKEIQENLVYLNVPFAVVKLANLKNDTWQNFSGLIISGGPILLTKVKTPTYLEQFAFLKTITIPVLGICLGHQILGAVYGAQVASGEKIERLQAIEIVRHAKLLRGIRNWTYFQENHREFITLPTEFKLLAKSRSAENEAMQHQEKPLYGVQFHPEVSGDDGKRLLRNFLK